MIEQIILSFSSAMNRFHRMAVKGSRRECKHDADSGVGGLGILPSDYVDRGDGLLISLDPMASANRTLLLPKSCPVSESHILQLE